MTGLTDYGGSALESQHGLVTVDDDNDDGGGKEVDGMIHPYML